MTAMFTLSAVAEQWGLGEIKKEPERWIATQLKSGRFRGRKFGRQWVMTADDIEHNEQVVANIAPLPEPVSIVERRGPSRASMQRRRSA